MEARGAIVGMARFNNSSDLVHLGVKALRGDELGKLSVKKHLADAESRRHSVRGDAAVRFEKLGGGGDPELAVEPVDVGGTGSILNQVAFVDV